MSKLTKMAAKEIAGIVQKQQRLTVLKNELEEINTPLYSPRGATLAAAPRKDGGNSQENKIIKIIDNPRRAALMREITALKNNIKSVKATLAVLNDTERQVIEGFYIKRQGIARIMEQTNYSERQINRIKFKALSKYAYARGLDIEWANGEKDGKKMAKK